MHTDIPDQRPETGRIVCFHFAVEELEVLGWELGSACLILGFQAFLLPCFLASRTYSLMPYSVNILQAFLPLPHQDSRP